MLIQQVLDESSQTGTGADFESQLQNQADLCPAWRCDYDPRWAAYVQTRPIACRDGVTIRGKGMDNTILDFKGQLVGAEDCLSRSDFVIEDLAIEDAKRDALKINEARNVVIRRVRTEWTGGPSVDNGAYGIYPVQTENTLIDSVVAIGARTRASTLDSRRMWSSKIPEPSTTWLLSRLRTR